MKYANGKLMAFASALLLAGAAAAGDAPATAKPAAAEAVTPGAQVVEFLFTVFKGKDAIHQAMLQAPVSEPELKELTQQAILGFDVREMASRYGQPLSSLVSMQEYDQCLKFMQSEDAAAAMAASNSAKSIQELPTALTAMPVERQRAFEAFFKLGCATKTLAFMGSPDGKTISKDYGKYLMCSHVQRTKPEMIPMMKALGECQGF